MKRLLVVEDEEHLANGLKFNLEAEGYAVDVEDNGEAALHRLTQGSNGIDLVLLDVMLPGLDGFEVVQRLRAAGSFVPVVMLTARGHTDDVLRGFEYGADDYLPKPFDLSIPPGADSKDSFDARPGWRKIPPPDHPRRLTSIGSAVDVSILLARCSSATASRSP